MKIILISGKAQSGKDTVAKMIKERLEKDSSVLITHYADLVKYISKMYFNWDGKKDRAGRSIIQTIGNDVREKNPNYWVDFLVGFLSMYSSRWDYVLIPDTRYKNEIEKLFGYDTITLRINRSFVSPLTQEQQNHISETELDRYEFDYVINSENGLDKLETEVDKFMNWLKKKGEINFSE